MYLMESDVLNESQSMFLTKTHLDGVLDKMNDRFGSLAVVYLPRKINRYETQALRCDLVTSLLSPF